MSNKNTPPEPVTISPQQRDAIKWVRVASELMDNRFRIPGTNIRFGLDSIVGVVPYVGDIAGFAVSGILVLVMVRYGASGMLVLRMLGNMTLDAVVGSVPVLGDIFDLQFKANRRNFRLLQAHYEEGKYKGSAWWFFLLVFGFQVLLAFLVFYIMFRLTAAVWHFVLGLF
ncbi:MAG: DUF4112 domain-containing protein [Saprospiraceae bacterium]|nr:DUF4112 domain-containing protein [Saprospiraceae bacterium]